MKVGLRIKLLVAALYCFGILHGQANQQCDYLDIIYTSISVCPPLGFKYNEAQDRFDKGSSSIRLESMQDRGFVPPAQPRFERPESWADSSRWTFDTIVDGRHFNYTSHKARSKGSSAGSLGAAGNTDAPHTWEGILRFGDENSLYYLVAKGQNLLTADVRALERSLLTVRVGDKIIDDSRNYELFRLDLSGFQLLQRSHHRNQYLYSEPVDTQNVAHLAEGLDSIASSTDSLSFLSLVSTLLATVGVLMATAKVHVTQYGKGTGAEMPTDAVVLSTEDLSSEKLLSRGECSTTPPQRATLGKYSARFVKYQCPDGYNMEGAIYIIRTANNLFRISYEVSNWADTDVARLDRAVREIEIYPK